MFVKVHKPLQLSGGNNKGSSGTLMDYLDKENEGKELEEKEGFFNENNNDISKQGAKKIIDSNNHRLASNDTKFYMFTINPSKDELEHLRNLSLDQINGQNKARGIEKNIEVFDINNNRHKDIYSSFLKEYTKDVMKIYADNFERENKDGKPIKIESKDLNFVAKLEHNRTWKSSDKLVQENKDLFNEIRSLGVEKTKLKGIEKDLIEHKIEQLKAKLNCQNDKGEIQKGIGDPLRNELIKSGNNEHIHVVVSRQTKSKWLKGERVIDENGKHLRPLDPKEISSARGMKLSPDAKTKNKSNKQKLNGQKVNSGFNHERFKENVMDKFKEKFNYKPKEKEQYKPNSKTVEKKITASVQKAKSKVKSKATGLAKKHLQGEVLKTEEKIAKAVKSPIKGVKQQLKEKLNEIKQVSLKDALKGKID